MKIDLLIWNLGSFGHLIQFWNFKDSRWSRFNIFNGYKRFWHFFISLSSNYKILTFIGAHPKSLSKQKKKKKRQWQLSQYFIEFVWQRIKVITCWKIEEEKIYINQHMYSVTHNDDRRKPPTLGAKFILFSLKREWERVDKGRLTS